MPIAGYAAPVLGDSGVEAEEPRSRADASAEQLLARWRGQVLKGVIVTSWLALIPPISIAFWQSTHGVPGTRTGAWLALVAFCSLSLLGMIPMRYELRARTLIALGVTFTVSAIVAEGLAPAQFVSMCMLTTICVLLFSARAAFMVLGACVLATAVAAYAFKLGLLTPVGMGHLDARNPLNWLRVSLYTMFPSATAAVATSYLLDKLRETLHARTSLVAQLSEEVRQRERALAQLERAQAQLLHAQKLEAIGQLAAGIAHDFNNTLSVISLEAELLKRQVAQQPDLLRGAESVFAAAERGTQLTRQLLLFGRPESSERTVVDAVQAFADSSETLLRLLPSEISLQVENVTGMLPVRIKPSELQQMVLNLGINARDAMPQGGTLRMTLERCELTASAAQALSLPTGAYALLCCNDTGAGMNEATLARIFEPFFSTKGQGRGTGLGLTNVWNIARLAGGCVRAGSVPGQGTRFIVYLPLSDEPISAPTVNGARVQHGHETVLVVEDDIRIRALLVTTLTDAGYTVLDASGVDAALRLEGEYAGAIDLLCTDVVMPGRPARELISELRARRPRAGVLVCSGYSSDELIARGIESGELKYLPKPFTRRALLSSVRAVLDRS